MQFSQLTLNMNIRGKTFGPACNLCFESQPAPFAISIELKIFFLNRKDMIYTKSNLAFAK